MKSDVMEPRHALAYLQDIQKKHGYIPRDDFFRLAADLKIAKSELYSIVTFYKALSLIPKGKYTIKVCDGTACHIRGSFKLLDAIRRELNIEPGQTSSDMLFSLEVVNCLGACAIAPAMMIGDKYYGKVTAKSLVDILNDFRRKEADSNAG